MAAHNAFVIFVGLLLAACGENNTGSYTETPGEKEKAKTHVLESGAKLLQDRQPLDVMSAYLNGFHFYNGDPDGQMEAHHYFSIVNEDVMQAVIFDGNSKDSRIMGVEYVISERLFKQLPPEEKALWHSHAYEVKSGTLTAPGIPAVAELELMKKIVSTYGKTWHTWHTDRDKELPYGVPALMMGFTADGQLDPRLIADRDRRLEVNTEEIKKRRADIPAPPVDPGANAWEKGNIVQLQRVQGAGEHGKHMRPATPQGESELQGQGSKQ
jgi:hypothetical protein